MVHSKKNNLIRIVSLLTILICISGNPVFTASDTDYYVLVIDRSGSMSSIWPCTGLSRLESAKSLAVQDVNIMIPQGAFISILSFESSAIVLHQDWTSNKTDAINAINSIADTGNLTPIADALCFATQRLKDVTGASEHVIMYTDGGENASNGDNDDLCDPCYPPSGGWLYDCDPSDGTPPCSEWQSCLIDQLTGEGTFTFRYFGLSPGSKRTNPDLEDSVPEEELRQSSYHPTYPELAYFQYLVNVTGGSLLFLMDDCLEDSDGDGIENAWDNCIFTYNPNQQNSDNDSHGDACDNCPDVDNENQWNSDNDSHGDACDNCPNDDNENQQNSDNDSRGDACDNCPDTDNENQQNSDNDIHGDACDNCPNADNENQQNSDNDNHGDACDNCPNNDNEDQNDIDEDGIGDACDNDDDNDGVDDVDDNCPTIYNPLQTDTDDNGIGNVCEGLSGVYLDDVDGLVGNSTDSIWAGQPITFRFRLANRTEDNIWDIICGYGINSPDGAEWDTTFGDFEPEIHSMFDLNVMTFSTDVDGISPDTFGFYCNPLSLPGIPGGYLGVLWTFTIGPISPEFDGKTICIDSVGDMPGFGQGWEWYMYPDLPGSPYSLSPDWDGPHCFTVMSCNSYDESILDGENTDDWFGYSVAGGGDFNGDGVPDYAVGAPHNSICSDNGGMVYLYNGSTGNRMVSFCGTYNDEVGYSVAIIPDLNDDGKDEIAYGAPNYHNGINRSGAVFVRSSIDGSAMYVISGFFEGSRYGASIANVGDIDNGGKCDFAFGAPFQLGTGGVLAHSGEDGSFILDFYGENSGDKCGWSVDGLGDVDYDDVPDIIIGAPNNSGMYTQSGKVYIVSGSTEETIRIHTGEGPYNNLGYSVAGVGDINDDDVNDYVIGAPGNNEGGGEAGKAYIYSGATGETLYEFTGYSSDDWFGIDVADAGDVNGDGYNDIIIGASGYEELDQHGATYIYSGQNGALLYSLYGSSAISNTIGFGEALSGLGDLNGDCFGDVIIGAWAATPPGGNLEGRAFVYLMEDICNPDPICPQEYICGDANGDESVNLGDAVYINNLVFHEGPPPDPQEAGDVNCDGSVNLGDAVYLINFIFHDGPVPCAWCK